MRDKLKLARELIKQLPAEHNITAEQARILWFYNIKNDGGLRLTKVGYEVLKLVLKLENYVFNIPDKMAFNQQTLLNLDRRLQHPYYIVTKKNFPMDIVFFSSKEAMLANLYGDLEKFLDNYKD